MQYDGLVSESLSTVHGDNPRAAIGFDLVLRLHSIWFGLHAGFVARSYICTVGLFRARMADSLLGDIWYSSQLECVSPTA